MIVVNYGKDWIKTTYGTLAASDIGEYLRPGMTVSVKPNLVNASRPSNGATTHPEVVEGIIKFLRDFGIKKINIMESSSVGQSTKRAFDVCGYRELEKKYDVSLIDLKGTPTVTLHQDGLDIKIAEAAMNADFLINVPVLKAHCQTKMTCCIKNLKGCIPENEMRRFHTLGLHRPIAALFKLLPVHFNVVDGICGDLSFEEGGSPVEANRIIAGRNAVPVDAYCAELIGYKPEEIGYLNLVMKMDLPKMTKIVELGAGSKPKRQQKSTRLSERYQNIDIEEESACSVCYASLIHALHRSGARPRKKICIGQGFEGKNGDEAGCADAVGIGNCTRGFANYAEGCPPKATDIMEALR